MYSTSTFQRGRGLTTRGSHISSGRDCYSFWTVDEASISQRRGAINYLLLKIVSLPLLLNPIRRGLLYRYLDVYFDVSSALVVLRSKCDGQALDFTRQVVAS